MELLLRLVLLIHCMVRSGICQPIPYGETPSRPSGDATASPSATLAVLQSSGMRWLTERETRMYSNSSDRDEEDSLVGGPGLLLSALFFAPTSEIKESGASEIISVTRHNPGTNHRNGKCENLSLKGMR